MKSLQVRQVRPALLVAAACLFGFAIAGCDDRVQITRDPDVRIARGMTWAWRPAPEDKSARDTRPVVSRDVITRGQTTSRENDPNAEVVRDRVKNAIAQTLTSKGLKQVSDPATADFLADYHFAVERRDVNAPVAYGGYPGLVCGPFGCYEGWGPAAYGYEQIRFREGTIVFDFLQQSTKHQVYRAIGEKPVRRDTFSLTQDEINGLVHHLLRDLKVWK
jgi:Domain of unknown function (DUF4136)